MVETVIILLIYLCFLVGLVYLVFYVLEKLDIKVPPKVATIVWVVVLLVALLLLWRAFGSDEPGSSTMFHWRHW